jgi:Spy/CpxP family protein refolding chaperone
MMKRLCMTLCVALLLFGVQTASAQRPGGGRGPGGFGGGPVFLLANEAVQKELNIAQEQREKLREIAQEMREGAGQRGDFQNLSQEERQKRVAEMQERAKKAEEKINTVLDAKQKERLEQLRIQREGASALARDEVAEKVGLAADQKEKIQKIQQEARGNFGGGGQNFRDLSNEDRQKLFAEMRERREKVANDILGVLNAEQKEKFEKLKGAKFDFPNEGRGRQRNNDN